MVHHTMNSSSASAASISRMTTHMVRALRERWIARSRHLLAGILGIAAGCALRRSHPCVAPQDTPAAITPVAATTRAPTTLAACTVALGAGSLGRVARLERRPHARAVARVARRLRQAGRWLGRRVQARTRTAAGRRRAGARLPAAHAAAVPRRSAGRRRPPAWPPATSSPTSTRAACRAARCRWRCGARRPTSPRASRGGRVSNSTHCRRHGPACAATRSRTWPIRSMHCWCRCRAPAALRITEPDGRERLLRLAYARPQRPHLQVGRPLAGRTGRAARR